MAIFRVAGIFLVLFCLSSAARVERGHPANRKLRKGSKAVARKVENSEIPNSLAVIGDKCKCKFVGHCTCRQAIQFMDCISDACASGECDCHEKQFQLSCYEMADTCSSIGMGCTEDKATCTHMPVYKDESTDEILADLAEMKERKCKLEEAQSRGYLNADNRLRELEPKIQGALDMLKSKDFKEKPNMDCDKPMLTGKVAKEEEEEGEKEEDEEEEKEEKEEKKPERKKTEEKEEPAPAKEEKENPMAGNRTFIWLGVIAATIGGLVAMMFLCK